ncbi:MAG: C25 family cysteine peptidase [Anaerolineae bacterium]|nr:C25 family cysteine peptidase [Anaerolineae bacterium]
MLAVPISQASELNTRLRLTEADEQWLGTESAPQGFKVFIEADGLYRIGYDDLREAGFDPAGLDPRTLRLTCQGVEQPIHIWGEDDGRFDPDDVILFYGQALTSTYTARNVCWLSASDAAGLRMAGRDGSPVAGLPTPTAFLNTLYMEENHTYWQNPPGGQAWDHWYWHQFVAPAAFTVTFTLSHIAPISDEARLQVVLQGKSDAGVNPDHHTRLWLNGHLLDDAWWDGQSAYQPALVFPQALLHDGLNTLTIASAGDTGASADRLYLNRLRLDYWDTYTAEGDRLEFRSPLSGTVRFELTSFTRPDVEVFDITDPAGPVRILNPAIQPDGAGYRVAFADAVTADSRYLALTTEQRQRPAGLVLDTPSDLRSPANGADYIIISYGDFITATLPLAAHYRNQGLRVAIVDVADVYDEFSAGIFDPAAIRDFLAYAYHQWSAPPPAYVLLVGDANLDFRDHYGTGPPNYVPTHIFDTPLLGETPGDNWFVAVDGDDILPDMAIGRFPARSAAEVTRLVEKTLAHATAPPGPWQGRALFVADDDSPEFADLNEALAALLPRGALSWRVDARHYPPGSPTADLIGRLNEGVLLLHYSGHGAVDHWGSWAGGYIFSNSNVASLSNGERLPFVTSADCISGFFALPGATQSLAETLLTRQGGGAVAVWSPTGLGYTAAHEVLFTALYRALFGAEPISIGAATTAAKVAAYGEGEVWADLVETYTLFGDPALRLAYRPFFSLYLPLLAR